MTNGLDQWQAERRLIVVYLAERPGMGAATREELKQDSRVVDRMIRYYGARLARETVASC